MDEQCGSEPNCFGSSARGDNTLVIYHGCCNDGFCAAWVARKVLPNAQFYPACHGTPPPDVRGKDVLMLDFAYKRRVMEALAADARSMLVLDHHKTAEADLTGLSFCRFNMAKSGATMSWEHFRDNIKGGMPWLVAYAEDRDLNKWSLPFTREINAALTTYPMDFRVWDALERVYPTEEVAASSLVVDGRTALRCHDRLIETVVLHSRLVRMDEHIIRAGNTSVLHGEVAAKLAQDHLFGLSWYKREDGKFMYSLRSREDGIDVSEIASRHGGGGHHHAAGFETDTLILTDV